MVLCMAGEICNHCHTTSNVSEMEEVTIEPYKLYCKFRMPKQRFKLHISFNYANNEQNAHLWQTVLDLGIHGKILTVIQNMYKNAKIMYTKSKWFLRLL